MIDIVAIRKKYGLTAKDLSEALSISQTMMCDMEKGRRGLGDHLIERCTHLKIKADLIKARSAEYREKMSDLKESVR